MPGPPLQRLSRASRRISGVSESVTPRRWRPRKASEER
jgi:hypothetical protein